MAPQSGGPTRGQYSAVRAKKQLRGDFVISNAAEGDGALSVVDPISNKAYYFDHRESYLIQALQAPHNETVLLARYNAWSSAHNTQADLHAFLDRLAACGLLQQEPGAGAP